MSSKAPTEIWHIILKHSISVPLFFDSDPVQTFGIDILREYSYELPYWQSERTRNSLRRVCQAWNEFLRPYGHRFIRLDDVVHQRVPASALPLALRIDIDGMRNCRCDKFCYNEDGFVFWERMRGAWNAAPFSSQREVDEAGPILWNVEIVKGWIFGDGHYHTFLARRAPGLKVMISQPFGAYVSSSDFPQTLRLFLAERAYCRSSLEVRGLPFLTALHAELDSLELAIDKWDLPALRHLSIGYYKHSQAPSQDDLYRFVQGIGPQLLTFHFAHSLLPESIDSRLWDALPIVKGVQLPYMWRDSNIPHNHPLQRVQIGVEYISKLTIDQGGLDIWEMIYPRYIPHTLDQRWTIRMDISWNEALFSFNTMIAVSIYHYYRDLCTLLVDVHGDTFVDYVVFLITAFWRYPGRKYRRAVTNSETVTNLKSSEESPWRFGRGYPATS